MAESELLSRTLTLLRARRGQFRTIAAGAHVEYHWLQSLSQGRIADPGVKKIERLHNYLASLPEPAPQAEARG